jgi:mRNA interferase RelE/StbE
MNWRVEIDPRAVKQLDRLPPGDRRRILDFLYGRVSAHPNPVVLAKRLSGSKEELSRFRVGSYRLIVKFINSRLVVLVIEIGDRREIYR